MKSRSVSVGRIVEFKEFEFVGFVISADVLAQLLKLDGMKNHEPMPAGNGGIHAAAAGCCQSGKVLLSVPGKNGNSTARFLVDAEFIPANRRGKVLRIMEQYFPTQG